MHFSDAHQMISESFPDNNTNSVEFAKFVSVNLPAYVAKWETKGKKEMFCVGIN